MDGTKGTNRGGSGPRQGGVTLVELLVTIVISGLFFAALVPVFVMASQQGQTDNARVLAMNAAQSAIEVLRDIPYDQLHDTDWTKSASVAGVADPHWKGENSGLDITVEPYPLGSSKGSERYLKVTVKAWWVSRYGKLDEDTGLSKRDVTLQTAVYRQGLGTQTLLLYAYPLNQGFIRALPVNVVARMDAADAYATERIDFQVWANNGTIVDEWTIYTNENGTALHAEARDDGYWYYETSWNPPSLADGSYTLVANSRPVDPTPENPDDALPPGDWARKVYVVDLNQPPTPTIDVCRAGYAKAGDGSLAPEAYLAWSMDNVSDVGHFEIWRTGTAADGTTVLPAKGILLDSKLAVAYVDRDVLPGATYVYKVMVEDAQGGRGDWSATSSCVVPLTAGGTAPEQAALPFAGSASGRSVKLTWMPSPSKASVDLYRVYRDSGLTMPIAAVETNRSTSTSPITCTDLGVDYGGMYTYFVTAVTLVTVDGKTVELESAPRQSPLVMVPEPAKVGMRIQAKITYPLPVGSPVPDYAVVIVHSLDTGEIYPPDQSLYPSVKVGSTKKDGTWVTGNNLYPGRYEVIGMFYTRTHVRCGTYTSAPVQLSASDTPATVYFLGPN